MPLVRSLNDYFLAPHSRYTEVRKEDIKKVPELALLAESREAGVFLVMSRDGRQVFVQGHPEYDRMTLNNEYHRDLKKGLNLRCPTIIMKMTIPLKYRCLPGEIHPIRCIQTG